MVEIQERSQVVLVTGCGSGLGYVLARQLYSQTQFRVVVTARTEESVELLSKEFLETKRFIVMKLDVCNKSEREFVLERISHLWGGVDILINNAAICFRSVVEDMDEDAELRQLSVNYLAPLALIRALIPSMRERRSGHIVNVSSASGLFPVPTMGSYSASKHALEAASEALWAELKPFGIHVTIVQPGFIHSDSFLKVVQSDKAKLCRVLEGRYSEYYQSMEDFIGLIMRKTPSSPDMIADKIIKCLMQRQPPLWVAGTWDTLILAILRHMTPRNIFCRISFRFFPRVNTWGKERGQSRAKVS